MGAGVCALALALAFAACSGGSAPADEVADEVATPRAGQGSPSAPAGQAEPPDDAGPDDAGPDVPARWSGVVDPTAIPLGDDRTSSRPAVGRVFSCTTTFEGGGALGAGPWIDEDSRTWDSTAKPQVEGARTWPQARYSETVEGDVRRIGSAGLPTRQVTGTFPVAESDPAYRYDPNPHAIAEHDIDLALPAEPRAAADPACVPMGPIGILKNGVSLFNALDAGGRDAAAHETQDVCDGHPDMMQSYHYHNISSCLLDAAGTDADRTDAGGRSGGRSSTLVGFALDGLGIYVERDSRGNLPTNADLDECHGRVSEVTVDGETTEVYHYSATVEFPYTVGCLVGGAAAVAPR